MAIGLHEATYSTQGMEKAKREVKNHYPRAEADPTLTGGEVIIVDSQSGKALSPICSGEGPAWRFAALMVREGIDLLDETVVRIK